MSVKTYLLNYKQLKFLLKTRYKISLLSRNLCLRLVFSKLKLVIT